MDQALAKRERERDSLKRPTRNSNKKIKYSMSSNFSVGRESCLINLHLPMKTDYKKDNSERNIKDRNELTFAVKDNPILNFKMIIQEDTRTLPKTSFTS